MPKLIPSMAVLLLSHAGWKSRAVDQCPPPHSHWPGYYSVICGCLVSPWPLSQVAWLIQSLSRCCPESSLRCFPRQNLSIQVLHMPDANITHSQVLSYSDKRTLSSAYLVLDWFTPTGCLIIHAWWP